MASTSKYLGQHCPPASVKVIKDYSYCLSDCIGQGYSSSVYRGKHDPTQQECAIKVINMKMIKDKNHRDLLDNQISCLNRMKNCKHVIQIKDVFETINNTYIVTEICTSGDLGKHLGHIRLSEQKAQEKIKQIIKGYLEIQRKGVIHRDLKPANIFVDGDQLKVADFGFATYESVKTKSGINVGSPLYMPPEALRYNQYSFKSDIWALGVIYFQMLFGKTPWRANTEKQLPRKMLAVGIGKLIPIGSVSSASLQFLIKTLNVDVKYRMSPEELSKFSFDTSFQDPQSCISQFKVNQIDRGLLGSPLGFQIQPKFPDTDLDRKYMFKSINKLQLPNRLEDPKVVSHSPKTQSSERGARELTDEFLSQIHLCRFIYKIIRSIQEVTNDCPALSDALAKLVYHKLNKIITMETQNPFHIENLDHFRQSSQFQRIISVSKKYLSKYQKELGYLEKQSIDKLMRQVYQHLTLTIKTIWTGIEDISDIALPIYEKEVILVDYLMTTYLLIKLEARSDLTTFHQKSKIEDIVEGNTHKVTLDHFKAIKQKVSSMGLY